MRALVIANGTPPGKRLLRCLAGDADLIVCADGGARAATAAGLRPHWVVGDLDSLAAEEVNALEAVGTHVLRFAPRKDETDLELALLLALERGATRITIAGALGGRIDQTLGNIGLLAMPALRNIPTLMRDAKQEIQLIVGEGQIHGRVGETVSLLPFGGDAVGVRTEGLEWALEGGSLKLGAARGVSNILTAPVATIRVAAGLLLAVRLLRPTK
ncbi:MAG: thiamine diphosphokinase [Anaerolineae bacterium]